MSVCTVKLVPGDTLHFLSHAESAEAKHSKQQRHQGFHFQAWRHLPHCDVLRDPPENRPEDDLVKQSTGAGPAHERAPAGIEHISALSFGLVDFQLPERELGFGVEVGQFAARGEIQQFQFGVGCGLRVG